MASARVRWTRSELIMMRLDKAYGHANTAAQPGPIVLPALRGPVQSDLGRRDPAPALALSPDPRGRGGGQHEHAARLLRAHQRGEPGVGCPRSERLTAGQSFASPAWAGTR